MQYKDGKGPTRYQFLKGLVRALRKFSPSLCPLCHNNHEPHCVKLKTPQHSEMKGR